MVNQKKKGSRVELELVHWLKDRGIESAQRTQQYNGLGKSDVIAPEHLPNSHIESKGVQSPLFTRGQLKTWADQLAKDCEFKDVPFLFCKPNNHPWLGMMFLKSYHEIVWHRNHQNTYKEVLAGESFNLSEKIKLRREWAETMFAAEKAPDSVILPAHYFYRVGPALHVVLMDAEHQLEIMKEYEDRIKNGVGESERRAQDSGSVSCRGLSGGAKKHLVGNGIFETTEGV